MSTSSALPLNHHLSSQLTWLAWRFFILVGLITLRLGAAFGLGPEGDAGCEVGEHPSPEPPACAWFRSTDSSASLRQRERVIIIRGDSPVLTPFQSQRSLTSLSPLSRFATQRRQSENRRKSHSFGKEPRSS